ncbi:MAG TPA: sulfite oxidase [Afifellaceae bacterium]|nr:sulfite oxidase [Afifellaceae bacterium]
MTDSPFFHRGPRRHVDGGFSAEELALANRNSGIALEMMRHDITPAGMHYLLNHFDIPDVDAETWRLTITGSVDAPLSLSFAELAALPVHTLPVTLECAGNGRAAVTPRYQSMPWRNEGVATAEWTGTPLKLLLERAGIGDDAVEIAFLGADRGFAGGVEHNFGWSLTPDEALSDDVLLCTGMNGAPLLPQHGFPVRLLVPGWYGMASVKWLTGIKVLTEPFDGYQKAVAYRYRSDNDDPGEPISMIRVKSLMIPPGVPDWFTRQRLVERGPVALAGRAWSGAGSAIAKVEVAIDDDWFEATLEPPQNRFAWTKWGHTWNATPGDHVLKCRATDENGYTQPLDPRWDNSGYGNNAVQVLPVTVR